MLPVPVTFPSTPRESLERLASRLISLRQEAAASSRSTVDAAKAAVLALPRAMPPSGIP